MVPHNEPPLALKGPVTMIIADTSTKGFRSSYFKHLRLSMLHMHSVHRQLQSETRRQEHLRPLGVSATSDTGERVGWGDSSLIPLWFLFDSSLSDLPATDQMKCESMLVLVVGGYRYIELHQYKGYITHSFLIYTKRCTLSVKSVKQVKGYCSYLCLYFIVFHVIQISFNKEICEINHAFYICFITIIPAPDLVHPSEQYTLIYKLS